MQVQLLTFYAKFAKIIISYLLYHQFMITKRLLMGALAFFGLSANIMASTVPTPDEGMWLPLHIKRLNHADMQKAGLKLSAEELYSINKSSLKDAIVSLGGFCTGEIISKEGLMLTNHHCGYDAIQTHSTVEKDYLTNGFWAMKREDELPNKGLTAAFLVRMEDVTAKVNAVLNAQMTEADRNKAIAEKFKEIKAEAEKGTHYNATVKTFFDGNEFYLFVYETFRDVRLVGAPPSSIGKFGGDTDNWMWPRHTGDFSMFRVYAGKDGKPADYSKDNVPLTPKHHLPVSLSGVRQGDYSMIFGYPGRTNRYLTSFGVKQALDITNPNRVNIRAKKLAIMKEDMDASDAVRIQYASKYAQISNYWKYFIGQSQGLKRLKVADKKMAEEAAFTAWVNQDDKKQLKYGSALADIAKAHDEAAKYKMSEVCWQEAANGAEIFEMAFQFMALNEALKASPRNEEAVKEATDEVKGALDAFYKDYNMPTDKKLLAAMFEMYYKLAPADQHPAVLTMIADKYQKDFGKYADYVFSKSRFTSKDKALALIAMNSADSISKDPAYQAITSILETFRGKVAPALRAANGSMERGNRLYVEGTMEFQKDKRKFYPNANSTMRMTYGKVLDYVPRDGAYYNYFTTLDGIMEKEDNTNEEFVVPKRLRELYEKKDYGQYAENGVLKVAFISNNDITGGNSGSPVINAKGELIGCAFDGNWEAMSGDIAFEPAMQRTISVDIRYVLFIIDKYAGATHLVNEMTLVRNTPAKKATSAAPKKAAAAAKKK